MPGDHEVASHNVTSLFQIEKRDKEKRVSVNGHQKEYESQIELFNQNI